MRNEEFIKALIEKKGTEYLKKLELCDIKNIKSGLYCDDVFDPNNYNYSQRLFAMLELLDQEIEYREYDMMCHEAPIQYNSIKKVYEKIKDEEMMKRYWEILPYLSIKYAMYAISKLDEKEQDSELSNIIFAEYARREEEKRNQQGYQKTIKK